LRIVLQRPEELALVVAHGLPVTYTVLAARGHELPLTLEGTQVDHATPYRLTREETDRAVEAMERWVRDHEVAA
jgi:hypothetical protein